MTSDPPRHRARPRILPAFLVTSLALAAGCTAMVPAKDFRDAQRDLLAARDQIQSLETQLAAQQQTIRTLNAQIANLAGVEGDPAEILIVPERIELVSHSGGYNDDKRPGDDGLILYVQPIDRDGHVIKAAGTIHVRLLDPQNPPEHVVIGDYDFDIAQTRALWYGRLMTNHFAIRCPWPDGRPPAHDEITARVVFTDLITGRALAATGTYKIALPPASEPPTP